MKSSQHPTGPCSCNHPQQHYSHAGRGARRAGDLILVLLALLCPPAVAHIKTGRRDLTLSIVLTLFGWAPGIFHAWWMILQHPGCHRCDRNGCSHDFPAYHDHHEHEGQTYEAQQQQAFARQPTGSEHGTLSAARSLPVQGVTQAPPPMAPQQVMRTGGSGSPVGDANSLAAWSGGSVKDHKGEQQEELPRYAV